MIRYGKRKQGLAVGLALLAGFVDALGFRALGGLFVSFMSGNSTRMAVDAAALSGRGLKGAALIAAFLLGVIAGAATARKFEARRKPVVLALVTLMLCLAAITARLSAPLLASGAVMAAAMGAANNVFQREGEVTVGVTYMTGALVKLGQQLVNALSGGSWAGWLSQLLLWLGLVLGAIGGASAFSLLQLQALWGAAAFAAILTLYAAGLGPTPPARS